MTNAEDQEIIETKDGSRAPIFIGNLAGKRVAFIVRSSHHVYRGGQYGTISVANEHKAACWMMDSGYTSYLASTYGVECMAVVEKETGTIWAAPVESWMDTDLLFTPRPEDQRPTYRGAIMTYLPLVFHRESPASLSLLSGAARARNKR